MKHGHRFTIGALMALALAAALALIASGGQSALAAPGIIYVDAEATGDNDGSSWDDAYTTLQPALTAATSGDEIWVAAGTYKPTSGTDRTASLQMKNEVAIYGGFAGTESNLTDRDWEANPTILSGDLNGDDEPHFANNDENSYHVFYHPEGADLDSSAILDGFTITGGNANHTADGSPHRVGGGMFNEGSSPTLTNCIFSGNSAVLGGGIYNDFSSLALTNCTFTGNSAVTGGGMVNSDGSSPTLISCTFSGNSTSNYAGGMYNDFSSPTLINCTFSGNAADYGGGMYNYQSTLALINCTFSGNSASVDGGGMYNMFFSSPTLTNCILWGNTGTEIYNVGSSPVVAFTDIKGGCDAIPENDCGTGNINADPLFVDADNGDFHLAPGSPCIDAGDNDVPDLPEYDFEGDARILDGNGTGTAIVDMGVDEYAPGGSAPVEVEVDIKPKTPSNVIKLGSGGAVPVAVLTTGEFAADDADPDTVRFAGATPLRWAMEDADRDGDEDLLLYFKIQELDLDAGSTEATLTGETFDGAPIEGTDTVRIIP